jgi:hypothetical protein
VSGVRESAATVAREIGLVRQNLTELVDRVAALQDRLRADTPTIMSLDRLAQRRHPATTARDRAEHRSERFEGEEAAMATDAWEITLITEEG